MNRSLLKSVAILTLFSQTLSSSSVVLANQTAEISVLDNRNFNKYSNYIFDTEISASNEVLDKFISGRLKQLNLSSDTDYIFNDKKEMSDGKLAQEVSNSLLKMAYQYKNKNSIYYNDKELFLAVKGGLEKYLSKTYNSDREKYSNWWYTDIGISSGIIKTLVLLEDDLSEDIKKQVKETYLTFVPNSSETIFPNGRKIFQEPANILTQSTNHLLLAKLTNDKKLEKEAIKNARNTISYNDNGIRKDGSYMAHNGIVSNASYGREYLKQLSEYLILDNTITISQREVISNYIDNGIIPIINKGELFSIFEGRGLSRKNDKDVLISNFISSVIIINDRLNLNKKTEYLLNDLNKEQINKLSSTAQKIIKENNLSPKQNSRNVYLSNEANKSIIKYSNGNSLLVSMYSDKVRNYESINGENLKGWYHNFGSVYLQTNDVKSFSDNYWATVNPYKIPGTTVSSNPIKNTANGKFQNNSFVGALSDNKNKTTSVSSMSFEDSNSGITGNKSYITLGNKLIVLGSNLKSLSNDNFYTTVENRRITGEIRDFKENGEKFFLESNKNENNIGYKILVGDNFEFSKETQKGSWTEINGYSNKDTTVYSDDYYNIQINHRNEDKFAYIMSHGETYSEFSKDDSIKIEELTEDRHVVTDGKTTIVVLFNDDEYEYAGIKFKKKGLYLLENNKLNYYNPEKGNTDPLEIIETSKEILNKDFSNNSKVEIKFKTEESKLSSSYETVKESPTTETKYLIIKNNEKIIKKVKIQTIKKEVIPFKVVEEIDNSIKEKEKVISNGKNGGKITITTYKNGKEEIKEIVSPAIDKRIIKRG